MATCSKANLSKKFLVLPASGFSSVRTPRLPAILEHVGLNLMEPFEGAPPSAIRSLETCHSVLVNPGMSDPNSDGTADMGMGKQLSGDI